MPAKRTTKVEDAAPEMAPAIVEGTEKLTVGKKRNQAVKATGTKSAAEKKPRATKTGEHVHRARKTPLKTLPASGTQDGSTTASAPAQSISALSDPGALQAEIAALAYSYWEQRGRAHGFATEDWLRAEREVLARRR